jgi:thioredoxin-related protein
MFSFESTGSDRAPTYLRRAKRLAEGTVSMGIGFRLLAVLACCVIHCGATSLSAKGWLRDVDHAWSVVQAEQRPMVLFVSMDGCIHCDRMIATTFHDPEVRRLLGASFVAAAIKGSERPDLLRQLQIQSFPTTVIVSCDGTVLDQLIGYVDAKGFKRRLEAIAAPAARPVAGRVRPPTRVR